MTPAAEPNVKEIMRRDVPTATPSTPISALARLMVEQQVPGVAIVDDGRLVGIVTEGDLIEREADVDLPAVSTILDAVFVADAGEPYADEVRHVLATTAQDLMSSPVVSIRDTATLTELATIMHQRRINPIPVVDESQRMVGLVTRADLVAVIARLEAEPAAGEPEREG